MRELHSHRLSAFVLALISIGAISPNGVAAEEFVLLVGADAPQSGGVYTAMNSGDTVVISATANRCYCCSILTKDGTDFPRFQNVKDSEGSVVRSSARGDREPSVPTLSGHPSPSRTRLCFTAEDTGNHSFTVLFGSDGAQSGSNVQVQCDETTMFGGYNTSITDFNFLELTNRLAEDALEVTITATDEVNGGTVIIDGETQEIEAGRRADVDIHSRAGAGVFGNLTLCHDGPKGALRAVLNQYNVITSSPLVFEPVASQELTTRK